MPETPLDLVFDEARRSVDYQASSLDELRSRTGNLLAAASVTTAFLGARVFDSGHPLTFWGWLAVLLFFLSGIVVVLILRPQTGWIFTLNAKKLIDGYIDASPPADLETMRRNLALHLHDHSRKNEVILNSLYRLFNFSCFLVVLTVISWLVALAGG